MTGKTVIWDVMVHCVYRCWACTLQFADHCQATHLCTLRYVENLASWTPSSLTRVIVSYEGCVTKCDDLGEPYFIGKLDHAWGTMGRRRGLYFMMWAPPSS
jgi:hypothetical protein